MVDKKTVKKVAQIARINLTEKELKKFSGDLNSILNAFKILDELNTKNVKPTFQPIEVKNVMRDDKIEKSLTQKEALSNTKNKEKKYFKGPRAL